MDINIHTGYQIVDSWSCSGGVTQHAANIDRYNDNLFTHDIAPWNFSEICEFIHESYDSDDYNTKHFPVVRSCIIDSQIIEGGAGLVAPDPLDPDYRDPLDLGFDFDDGDMFAEDDLRAVVEHDHQNFNVNKDHVSSLTRSLPIRDPTALSPILMRCGLELSAIGPELDNAPQKHGDGMVHSKLKVVKLAIMTNKYRDDPDGIPNDIVFTNHDDTSRTYARKSFTPVTSKTGATLICVNDTSQYLAYQRILRCAGSSELSGIAVTNSYERAGVLLAYGYSVITSNPTVYRKLRHLHNGFIINYTMARINSRNCVYKQSCSSDVLQLMFACPWTSKSPSQLQDLSYLSLPNVECIDIPFEMAPSVDQSYLKSVRRFKYRRKAQD